MAFPDDFLDFFACCLIDIRPVIQHTADRGHGDTGHLGDIPDRIDLHGYEFTPVLLISGNGNGNVFSERIS